MNLSLEFDRLVNALENAGVDYALAGGLAVAVWGAARATKDIDLLVEVQQLEEIKRVARSCGFTLEAGPMTFRDGMELRRINKVEDGDLLTLDLLLVNDSLRNAWQSRQRVETKRGPLWVLSREALIELKTRAGRPQDVYDIERLRELDR